MQVVSLTEMRNNFKKYFDMTHYENEEIVIHRKNDENVVMLSLEKFNSLKKSFQQHTLQRGEA